MKKGRKIEIGSLSKHHALGSPRDFEIKLQAAYRGFKDELSVHVARAFVCLCFWQGGSDHFQTLRGLELLILLPFLGCCSVRMRAIIPTFRRQILPPS
jgi:hypothetical protein